MRLLLVENDIPAMRLMGWALVEEGFEVSAVQPADVVVRLSSDQDPPDCVVFNTMKSAQEKAKIIADIRALNPAARVIDVTESPSEESYDTGADAYLGLPLQARELVKMIQEICGT